MSAVPRDPFVKLREFLSWALRKGCTIQTGFTTGGYKRVTVVTAPDGKHVAIIDLEDDQAVPLPMYEYYARRLGFDGEFRPTTLGRFGGDNDD